jgi:hypothetical protein
MSVSPKLIFAPGLPSVNDEYDPPSVTQALDALQTCADMPTADDYDSDSDIAEDVKSMASLPQFVKKLKALVDDPGLDGAQWNAEGTCFVVKDTQLLSKQLVKVFKASQKLSSFVRQLHFYGFKKISGARSGDGSWVYFHKHFQANGENLHRVRKMSGGADKQVKKLKSKVKALYGSLAQTQEKLSCVASALVNLLKEKCPAASCFDGMCNGSHCQPTVETNSTSTSLPSFSPRQSDYFAETRTALDRQFSTDREDLAPTKRSRNAPSPRDPFAQRRPNTFSESTDSFWTQNGMDSVSRS